MDKLLDFAPRRLVAGAGLFAQKMDAAMDIAVAGDIEFEDFIQHLTGFLGGGGIVQINQRLPVNLLG